MMGFLQAILQVILFLASAAFLFTLVVAKLLSSTTSSSSAAAPDDHIGCRHGCVELSASVAGGCGGGYVVIEEDTRADGGREEFDRAGQDLGRREGDGEALEEKDGAVEVEFVVKERSQGLDFGKADVGLVVEGDGKLTGDQGPLGAMDVSLLEEETVVKDIPLDSGGGPEENGEQSFVGGEVGDPDVVSLPADEKLVEEGRPKGEVGVGEIEDEEGKALLLDDDDDWEGIERSAVEKLFDVASAFVGSVRGRESLSRLSSELQLQLYGLYKIATEGPCYEMQPLAFKVSARSKWHAWKKLGNMNPEVAMQQYIALLTKNVSEWMEEENCAVQRKMEEGNDSVGAGMPELRISAVTTSQHDQQFPEAERKEVF